ncbi:hypothetical protein EV643_126102 [Kribbella sp. VKM Ac-2527]|uniref:Uncharacterized protein n=1 Tax=Kribbella caucasensis TaxID=2512215 RepID=A0A4R6JGD1_9ACTN|nr:hypothetical protein [Kribbella sp. VKM Ac-2527]TDO34742.1 hypothetical protein EV643_126102 [Kribbella sp. VKM Ac-2527]
MLTEQQQRDWFLREITEEIKRYPEQAEESDYQAGFVKGVIDAYVRAAHHFDLIDGDMLGDYMANELGEVPHEFENLLPRADES